MRKAMTKLVAVLSIFSLLGMSALLITSPTTVAASPSPDIGRVTVSGTDILVDGVKPDEPFFECATPPRSLSPLKIISTATMALLVDFRLHRQTQALACL